MKPPPPITVNVVCELPPKYLNQNLRNLIIRSLKVQSLTILKLQIFHLNMITKVFKIFLHFSNQENFTILLSLQ